MDGDVCGPEAAWATLDDAWREAFRQAWKALRTGNVAVGACVTTADGRLLHAARNRVTDGDGPPGEIWGSALAHAEINVLARVGFRSHEKLVLTSTLEPCLQCAAAIRLARVGTIRFAGADRYWEGCHDFTRLSAREASRRQPVRQGPRHDELGLFATLISRLGPSLTASYEAWLRGAGEEATVELARRIQADGGLERLAVLEVDEAFAELWPALGELRHALAPGGRGETWHMPGQDGPALAHSPVARQAEALEAIVRTNPVITLLLDRLPELELPSWYLGAGGIAQTVWNHFHGFASDYGIKDYNVVYFDPDDLTEASEKAAETRVTELIDGGEVKIDLTNEARVHAWYERRFGRPLAPYRSAEHAIATWPTTATSVGVRSDTGEFIVCAPFGLADLFSMTVRPNTTLVDQAIYQAKAERWRQLWPQLTVLAWP